MAPWGAAPHRITPRTAPHLHPHPHPHRTLHPPEQPQPQPPPGAFEVDDTVATTDRLVGAGAQLTATPRKTPWRSINSRMDAPADLQITLFQELETPDAPPTPAHPHGVPG